jgi:hypothetical protein
MYGILRSLGQETVNLASGRALADGTKENLEDPKFNLLHLQPASAKGFLERVANGYP